MEVISVGVIHYSAFVPCIVSASIAYGIIQKLHIDACKRRKKNLQKKCKSWTGAGHGKLQHISALPVVSSGTAKHGVAPLLGLDATLGAAIGMISLFCSVVNCPLASVLLSIELFGHSSALLFCIVFVKAFCAVNRNTEKHADDTAEHSQKNDFDKRVGREPLCKSAAVLEKRWDDYSVFTIPISISS